MIAIDIMGGDNAPKVVLQGALAAARNAVPVMLCGPEKVTLDFFASHEPNWKLLPIKINDAPDVIEMGEEPISAIRRKSSSLVKAVTAVAQGQSNAVLSAGNSGALMAAAIFVLGRSDGVDRPAIAGFVPTVTGKNVLVLDLGANTECRPAHLQTFAHLGREYVERKIGIQNPRIGLLANGHEEGKGSLLVKDTHALLKADALNFVGNVEPYHIFNDHADVVVCDGFSGNIFLKTMESTIDMISHWITQKQATSITNHFEHKTVGGALLLGVKGSVVVCHGNSDAIVIENAINFAWNVSQRK